jgi:hypothetical protein
VRKKLQQNRRKSVPKYGPKNVRTNAWRKRRVERWSR